MARLNLRLADNAEGELYVDLSCIDCDLCRDLAPGHEPSKRTIAKITANSGR